MPGSGDRMLYDEEHAKVDIRVKSGYLVKFNSNLARRLGTGRYHFRSTSYVYCDLLEPIPVGDVIVPLLHIVNLYEKMKKYSNMHRITKRVLFVPVQKKHFDTIEIQILDSTG